MLGGRELPSGRPSKLTHSHASGGQRNIPMKMNMVHRKRSNWISLHKSLNDPYLCPMWERNNYVIKRKLEA